MSPARFACPLLGVLAASAMSASGAIVLNFANATGTFDGSVSSTAELTASSLADGTPTDSDPGGMDNRLSISGTLAGVSNTDSFRFLYDTYSTSSVDGGSNLTLNNISGSNMASNNVTGIASADGDINAGGRGIYFDFNLTSLPANTGLRITDLTATSTAGSGHNVQVVVDGISTTNLGGLTGSGLTIDITNGDRVAFRNVGSGGTGDRFRLTSLTIETFTIPEPSVALLSGLGVLLLLRRRK